ncbi:MAG: Gx transporter family protein [Faecalibacterium prausnitzii]
MPHGKPPWKSRKPTSRRSSPKNKGAYPLCLKITATIEKTRHIALSGLLFALAMALSFIEGTLVIPGLLPGMKLGLANIVVMYALFFMGPRQALVLDILKALFVFLVSGFTAGFLSLCGGLLSLAVMWVLYYLLPVRPTWFILSVCGALAHNVGSCWAQGSSSPRPVAVLCAGHVGAGACHGCAHLGHAAGAAARAGQNGLQHPRKPPRMTDHFGRAVAFWPEICIIRKQLYFYQKDPKG